MPPFAAAVSSLPLSAPDLVSLLRRRAEATPDRLWARFLLTGEVTGPQLCWTYGELDLRARAVAVRLRERCAPGDRVLLVFPPGLDFVAGWFGCLYAGLIAVPAYPPEPSRLERTLPRLRAIAADAGASAVLTIEAIAGMAEGLGALAPELAALPWLSADDADPIAADAWHHPRARPEDIAFLQYTSGSTGEPKGVMVTHHNVLHNSAVITQGFGTHEADRGVSWLPMFHDMGLIGNIAHPIDIGSEMIFLSPEDFLRRPMRWLEAISALGGTASGGPDFAYGLCARRATDAEVARLDLSGWTLAYSGAEPVRAETLDAFARRFGPAGFRPEALYPTYGLAEATLFVSGGSRALPHARRSEREVGCGDRRIDTALAVVDPATGRRLPAGQTGEIWVQGPSVARGYWRRPERTREVFQARITGEEAVGTWLRTGDLGLLDGEELYVAGRIKDLIIVRGRNVYPQDIERAAEAADAVLRPGCVVALGVPPEAHEEGEGVALVAEIRGPLDAATAEALRARLQEAVMEGSGASLRRLVLLAPRTIPKTSSGKLRRHACAALLDRDGEEGITALYRWRTPAPAAAAAATTAPAEAVTAADPVAELREWMVSWLETEQACPAGEIDPDLSLAAQGVDSIRLAALAGELERRLGFEVPGELFYGRSLTGLAEQLCARHGGSPLPLSAGVEAVDLVAESRLPADIQVHPRPERRGDALFLTGATGFLGGYLLRELLERTGSDVICLVRAADAAEGLGRIRDNLARFGLWRESFRARLRVLPGDLAKPRFGWNEARFHQVAGQVSAIYHCGAQVHWAAPFSALAPINVGGTAEALRLAAAGGGVAVHHVSSVGVYPIGMSSRAPFPEQAPLEEGELLRINYFRSKWAAEKLAEQARERGIPVSIYRPGFISGDSRTGAESDSAGQLYCAFLEGCLQMGQAPRVDKVLDLQPVDFVAQAIAAISLSGEAGGRSFNLRNPSPMRQGRYYARLRAHGYPLAEVAYPRWRRAVLELPASSGNPLVRFGAYYRAVTEQTMRHLEVQMAQALPVEDTAASALLERLGVRCPAFDEALLDRYLGWYTEQGLVRPPPAKAEAEAILPLGSVVGGGLRAAVERGGAETTPAAITSRFDVAFCRTYTGGDERLDRLYGRAKERQWDAAVRIDWSLPLDPESAEDLPDAGVPLFGSPIWQRLTRGERDAMRHHFQAWQLSQYMHGEQGALLAAAKLVQQVPGASAKLYAATQVMDEARHLETFSRLLEERFQLTYGVNRPLAGLLEDVLSDGRWDMTCLGMQVLIEGLALAAFATMREQSRNPLMRSINAAIMEDEARHLAFGRLLLAEHYARLTDAERSEREEFVVEACYALRDRFRAEEVWQRLGLPVAACTAWMEESGTLRQYRAELFSRVAPTVRAVGLMGPRVEEAFAAMGVLHFAAGPAAADPEAILAEDRALLGAPSLLSPA